MSAAAVKIRDLVKVYANEHGHPVSTAVKGLNLEIADGEFMVLVGPSGCGKSTTLRMIAGLEEITGGEIEIGGRVVNQLEPRDRGIAMVFQNYALYPHMTVFDNMAFGLKLAGKDKAYIRQTVTRAASTLGLESMLQRKPKSLSGGQRQRVALGRAIVRDPKVFLFDEPLSNLDARMRVQLRAEISRLHAELRTTMIYVTHDQVEAMTMGDRICVMRDGLMMQVADPLTLYRSPANVFVAEFIGSPAMNLLPGKIVRGDGCLCFKAGEEFGALAVPLEGGIERMAQPWINKEIILGVRPEHLVSAASNKAKTSLTLPVELAEQMGAESVIHLKTGKRTLTARIYGEHFYRPGETFAAAVDLDKAHLFDPQTENAITEKT
jgi:multiple sugar transport system ATP-binding protein